MPDLDETTAVLRRYLRGDRLIAIPRGGRKREIVLQHIAGRIEPGVHYDEPELHRLLRPIWDDVAAVRRYLVEAGLLDRTPDGIYWRSGGPVDV